MNTQLKKQVVIEEIVEPKQSLMAERKTFWFGRPGLIVAMANLDLIDECQQGIQPTVLSNGLPLFTDIINSIKLTFLKTKIFDCGVVFHYYEPAGK